MDQVLYEYELNPTTWVYLSSLMTIAIFFRFNRLLSIRNLDILALVALSPGPLLVARGGEVEWIGYLWLFVVGGFFMVRLLADPALSRRPLLEPNLSLGGLTFMTCALFVFLMTSIAAGPMANDDLAGARQADDIIDMRDTAGEPTVETHRPGYRLLHVLASAPSRALIRPAGAQDRSEAELLRHTVAARAMAILSHLAVVLGLVVIGVRHFGSVRTGIASAGLYLLAPCTAEMVGRVDHVLPAALLTWAIAAYRRPLVAGALIGLAAGSIFYPIFLLPLWLGFYWQRGRLRFLAGVVVTLGVLVASLALTSADTQSFTSQLWQMIGWPGATLAGVSGFWAHTIAAYRLTVTTLFVALSLSLTLWPPQKNLGTLIACSAAIMLGAQFWNPHDGGLYIAWYLPLLILAIFRPNLDDRVALAVLSEHWPARRRPQLRAVDRAA